MHPERDAAATEDSSSKQNPPHKSRYPSSLGIAANDNQIASPALDQYYTREDVAARLYEVIKELHDPRDFLMVEPSAGTGSFFRLLPPGSLGYDLDPRHPGVVAADFLETRIESERDAIVIGNPPFGRNSSAAVRFFNHAAGFASVIAMIVPRTFRKASLQNRLDQAFHLVREEPVPSNAFLFEGGPYDVPTVFQIWERRPVARALRPRAITHPDFEFTTPDRADFAIQRVGARAGRIHHDFTASPSSHLFVRGPVEAAMARLDLAGVAADTAGNPSVSKAEIVQLYSELTARTRTPGIERRAQSPNRRNAGTPRHDGGKRGYRLLGDSNVTRIDDTRRVARDRGRDARREADPRDPEGGRRRLHGGGRRRRGRMDPGRGSGPVERAPDAAGDSVEPLPACATSRGARLFAEAAGKELAALIRDTRRLKDAERSAPATVQ